jgi:hypothetical protein
MVTLPISQVLLSKAKLISMGAEIDVSYFASFKKEP